MVGKMEGFRADVERLFERKALFFQQAKQFGNGDDGMRIVELKTIMLVETVQIVSLRLLFCKNVLKRSAHHKILLTQPQHFSHHGIVVGIEHVGDFGCGKIFDRRLLAVHFVKGIEIKRFHRFALPQAQGVHHAVAVSENGHIVWNGFDFLIGKLHDHAVPIDPYAPGIASFEPIVALFMLITVLERLTEQSVPITNAVAVEGNVLRSGAFEIAGGKPSQTAVSEGGILHRLEFF